MKLEDASQRARDIFNRGFSAFERGNLNYAIDLLSSCVELEPRLLNARRYLRAAQIQKWRSRRREIMASVIAAIRGWPLRLRIELVRRRDPARALALAEWLMALNPLSPAHILVFAEIAVAADLPDVAIQTLEIARESLPTEVVILRALGDLYVSMDMTAEARECFEKLTDLKPHDHDIIKAYKDAMARESMMRDGWMQAGEADGTFRDAVKDSAGAQALEQEARAQASDTELDGLIEEAYAKIESDPENLNYYRALARLYAEKRDFDNGIAVLEKAKERRPGDPELDAGLSRLHVQRFEYEIGQAEASGDTEAVATLKAEKDSFVVDDLETRVSRYPSDTHLRYELGRVYYELDRITDAIRQLQAAQRSPKHRIMALFYLGMAFRRKGQMDLAVDQLKTAAGELVGMDETKKAVLYELGDLLSAQGDTAGALDCFKHIYQVDIGYRDVAARVEGSRSAD